MELAIWIVGWSLGSPDRFRIWVVGLAGFWPGLLGDWQSNFPLQPVTMFATYWLIHSGPGHLLGNLGVLAWFGISIGPRLRRRETWEIWIASVLGGGLAFGYLSTSYSPVIGASGGVFGLLGAFVVLDFRSSRGRTGLARAGARTAVICALIVALSILDYILRDAILAWQAHLGGFLAGAALTWAISAGSNGDRG